MKNIHDQFAKSVLKAALAQAARLESNREIPGHVLAADLWVEPAPGTGDVLDGLGALGRMVAAGPGLVEPFSGVPRTTELRSCILKQYSLDHAQRRATRTSGAESGPFPRLWVLASGSPESAIEQLELRPMDGWPAGFMTGRRFDPLHLVVIRKLPRTRETMLLRLLGRGPTFRTAARDLAALPLAGHPQAGQFGAVRQVLIEFRRDFQQHRQREDAMPSQSELVAAYDEWEHQMRNEGRNEGHREGRREALVEAIEGFCDILGVALSAQQRADMAQWDVARLESTVATLRATRRWPS